LQYSYTTGVVDIVAVLKARWMKLRESLLLLLAYGWIIHADRCPLNKAVGLMIKCDLSRGLIQATNLNVE